MRKAYDIPNIHDAIRRDYAKGIITTKQAAIEWYKHGHTNFVDMNYARRQLGERMITTKLNELLGREKILERNFRMLNHPAAPSRCPERQRVKEELIHIRNRIKTIREIV